MAAPSVFPGRRRLVRGIHPRRCIHAISSQTIFVETHVDNPDMFTICSLSAGLVNRPPPVLEPMWRLQPRGAANRGVAVDADGAMLGPDCPLVQRTASGYRAVKREPTRDIQRILRLDKDDPNWLYEQSQRICRRARSRRDRARANLWLAHSGPRSRRPPAKAARRTRAIGQGQFQPRRTAHPRRRARRWRMDDGRRSRGGTRVGTTRLKRAASCRLTSRRRQVARSRWGEHQSVASPGTSRGRRERQSWRSVLRFHEFAARVPFGAIRSTPGQARGHRAG
jgi:hypothetical protein